jgi:hypothetical protein
VRVLKARLAQKGQQGRRGRLELMVIKGRLALLGQPESTG